MKEVMHAEGLVPSAFLLFTRAFFYARIFFRVRYYSAFFSRYINARLLNPRKGQGGDAYKVMFTR